MLVRCLVFGALGICGWALLPLIAKAELSGGPLTYGVLLGSLGLGALFGAAAMPRLRQGFGTDAMVAGATAAFGLVTLGLAVFQSLAVLIPVLVVGGAAWLLVMSSFNVIMQMSAPGWIKGRAIALYYTALFGGMAFGSWLWGRVAAGSSIFLALVLAGGFLLLTVPLGRLLRLPEATALDVRPQRGWKPPEAVFAFDPASGPVLVTIEYLVPRAKAPEFSLPMQEMRRVRRRNGALHWGLYEDVERPERWLETFTLASWLEHLRQGERATLADAAVEARARGFHMGVAPPAVSALIVHRPGDPVAAAAED